MCIAVPSPVVELFDAGLPMAKVQRGDATVDVCVAYLPEVAVGDYVIVANGFAVQSMDAEAAAASLAAFEEAGIDLSMAAPGATPATAPTASPIPIPNRNTSPHPRTTTSVPSTQVG